MNMQIKNQTGAALIISMIILVLMTLLGLSSIRTSSLEEKMTANLRDQELAFQAAEIALRDAEKGFPDLPMSILLHKMAVMKIYGRLMRWMRPQLMPRHGGLSETKPGGTRMVWLLLTLKTLPHRPAIS